MATAQAKQLSFPSIFLLGVNGIVGSGVFLMPSRVYAQIGDLSIAVLPLAGLAVLTIALCFGNLASKIPGDGAAWLYTYTAFGRFAGFEVGIFTWLLGIITMATEISAFVTGLTSLVPVLSQRGPYLLTTLGILAVLGGLNLFGGRMMNRANRLSSVVKLGVLLAFVVIGAFGLHALNFANGTGTASAPLFGRFSAGFGMVFYMFSGFSFLPIMAAQMKNSERTLPLALISVLLVSTLLYTVVQLVAIGIVGPQLGNSNVPIALAFSKVLGSFGYDLAMAGMLVSILGVALTVSYSTPTVASSLASEHQLLPRVLGKQNRAGVPIVALVISVAVCAVLLISGDYLFLVSCIVFASFIQYVPTIFATILLRHHQKLPAGFVLPSGLLIPILALLVTGYLLFSFTWALVLAGVAVFLASAFWYIYDDRDRLLNGLERDIAEKDRPW